MLVLLVSDYTYIMVDHQVSTLRVYMEVRVANKIHPHIEYVVICVQYVKLFQ